MPDPSANTSADDLCEHCGRGLQAHLEDRGASCPRLQGLRLDRRRRHFMMSGEVYVDVFLGTRECTGCFEGGDYMGLAHHYPYDKKAGCHLGSGCDECGYTGKRREWGPVPASLFYLADGGAV